jgi:hypothetical protein
MDSGVITTTVTCDARPFNHGQCPERLEYVTTDVGAVYRAAEARGWTRPGTRHLCPAHTPRQG